MPKTTPKKNFLKKSSSKKVIKKTPVKKVVKKTPAKKVIKKTPKKNFLKESSSKKIVKKTPKKKISRKSIKGGTLITEKINTPDGVLRYIEKYKKKVKVLKNNDLFFTDDKVDFNDTKKKIYNIIDNESLINELNKSEKLELAKVFFEDMLQSFYYKILDSENNLIYGKQELLNFEFKELKDNLLTKLENEELKQRINFVYENLLYSPGENENYFGI